MLSLFLWHDFRIRWLSSLFWVVLGSRVFWLWVPGDLALLFAWCGGLRLLSGLGRDLLFYVPLPIRPPRACVVIFLPTIETPIVLSRCRFGVDLGVGPICMMFPTQQVVEFTETVRTVFQLNVSLLWNDKTKVKWKTCLWVSVGWKTKR
jgi:hypothetical protein